MSEYKLFVQRIGLVGITNILVALSGLILLPIITKSFSASDYGVWVQITTTIALLPNVATLGLPYTMIRFLSAEKDLEKIKEGFYSIAGVVLASTAVISLVLLLFSKSIAVSLFNGNTNTAMLLVPIIFLACMNAFLLNYFRTFQQMKRYSVFLLIQTYLGLFIVSYFAFIGYTITQAALGLLIANAVTFVLMLVFIVSRIGFKIPKFHNLREYLSFGLPTIPGNLSYWIVDSSDRYVIGILLGTTFVGYYSPGYILGNIIIMILSPFSLLLPAVLPKYYEANEMGQVQIFLKYSMKFFFLIAIPSAFGLSALSKPILMVITTQAIAMNGYMITPFIALSALLYGVYGIVSNILVLEKKTKVVGIVWIVAAILNLALNIILVPKFGIMGAAAVTLLAYVVAFFITVIYTNRYFTFDFDRVFIVKSTIASALMSMVIFAINPQGILNIIITVIICSGIYFGLLVALKGIKKEEVQFFRNMMNS
ncbi:hypothetical protein DSECCO2_54620 [anaerobic digester metagenome]